VNDEEGSELKINWIRCLFCYYSKKINKAFGRCCYHPILFVPERIRNIKQCPRKIGSGEME